MTEFLVQMQGVGKSHSGILVLGATNIPWEIDSAMRRRFEKRVYIPLPDEEARKVMFKVHLGNTPHNLTEENCEQLGVMSEGMSGSDIAVVVQEALMQPVRNCQLARHFRINHEGLYEPCDPHGPGAQAMTWMDIPGDRLAVPLVTMRDFVDVMRRAKASVGASELDRYTEWTREFGEEGT